MTGTTRQEYQVTNAPASRPYADAVRFGDVLFVSGLVGVDDSGAVGVDAAAQTRLIMLTLGRILEAAVADYTDVLKLTIFVTDMADRAAIAEIRAEFFGTVKPASTLVQVSALVQPEWKVEIEAVVGLKTPA